MNALRQALVDYLAMRRALGYKLARPEKLLAQFLTYLEDRGECQLTTRAAVAWATLPAGAHRSWMSMRLSVVRRFAAHLRGIDPATEVPPAELLPWQKCRATPYLYSEEEIVALRKAAETLRTSHRIATYRTLIGLLAVTGMRVGEAIALDRDDFDAINGLVVVRNGKFGKSRELPLHASSVSALASYLQRTDRPLRRRSTPALFVSTAGTRLLYTNVHNTFHRLVRRAGLTARSASCRPRLHDIRHYSGNWIIPATEPRGRVFGRMSHSPSHTWRNNQRGRQEAQDAIVGGRKRINMRREVANAKALGSVIASRSSAVLTLKRDESAALAALRRAVVFSLAHA